MMRLCYASQSRAVLIGVLFCAVQAFAEAASATSAVGGTDESVVEVELATAKPHALIQYGPEKIRALHAVGDMLFHPKDPTRFVEILEIGPAGAVIRDSATRRKRSLRVGDLLPGVPGVTLVGTVLLKGLRYRFKVVDRITPPETVLVSFEGLRALLEKQVLRKTAHRSAPQVSQQAGPSQPATRLAVDPQLFANVRLDVLDTNTSLLDANELKPLIEHVRQAVAPLEPMVTPALSVLTGTPVDLTSPLADATLSRSGFTVTNLKVAQFFGLQVGDTITMLNGHSVNSPLKAWWTFQEIFVRNPTLTELRVDLIREGKYTTKTFQIR